MLTAVDVQHLAKAGLGLTALVVAAALLVLPDKPCSLEHGLHERVRPMHVVVLDKLLAKVFGIETVVLVSVEGQDLLYLTEWRLLRRRLTPTLVQEAIAAEVLKLPLHAPHRTVGHSEDPRRLDPGELPVCCPENHFLNFHCPLHCERRKQAHRGTLRHGPVS